MLSLIVAVAENGVIGKGNALPWALPDDLQYFKEQTRGKTVVMGRKCYESIGRVLPQRRNIILTRDGEYRVEGAEVVRSKEEALAAMGSEAVVIGGSEVYKLFLPEVQRMLVTRVHGAYEGDAYFGAEFFEGFEKTGSTLHEADRRHECSFSFEVWDRIGA